jgi:hypothetical protein
MERERDINRRREKDINRRKAKERNTKREEGDLYKEAKTDI